MPKGNSKLHHSTLMTPWAIRPAVAAIQPSAIREILKLAGRPGMISFAGGLPAPELFPLATLQEIAATILARYGATSLQYSLTRGVPPLRELLASRATARGSQTTETNIHITTGSQQGLELIARLFIEPGDPIIVEDPSYVGAFSAFNCHQPTYLTVPIDHDGMLVDRVEELLQRHRPRFIYAIPEFQNPTGVTLSLPRRKRLVALAEQYNVPIVDDSPYADLRFSGTPLPSLKSLGGDRVIALRTFSKLIAPGLRIGWINAEAQLIAVIERVKQACDLHTSTFDQYIVAEFVSKGFLEPHVQLVCADYKRKRDLMVASLKQRVPTAVEWTEPEGGLFLWGTLPDSYSATALFEQAIAHSLAFVPGRPFYARADNDRTLRLNFSNTTPQEIEQGMTILGELITASATH